MSNLKLDEKQSLFSSKVRGGKDYDVANAEIRRDEEHLFNINRDIRLLRGRVATLESEVIRKNIEIKNLRQKMFDKDVKKISDEEENPIRKHAQKNATIPHLNRILSMLEEGEMGITKISEACAINKKQAMSALLFLMHHNLVSERSSIYSLKKEVIKKC